MPGNWDVPTFLFSYFMIGLFPVLFIGWKFIKKTKWRKAHEVDLKGEVEEIEEYTRNFVPAPYKYADNLTPTHSTYANGGVGMWPTSGSIRYLEVER